ncbi:GD20134 [Drosophila simulans]|uniref:GD20134 n=1 Tax=Drosophila simulans TaxID=7240 RepID=B4QTH0_DROSI|nr:GD20134 [Drosophila simulans]
MRRRPQTQHQHHHQQLATGDEDEDGGDLDRDPYCVTSSHYCRVLNPGTPGFARKY